VRRWLARASTLVSVVACWLGAYVLWTFAGGLAVHYGLLGTYHGAVFGLVAVAGGVWHYRAQVRAGYPRGLAVFVGVQLAWLAVVLLQNGVFGEVR
jgi:hypothetical protein